LSKNTVSDVRSLAHITNTAWHHVAVTKTGSAVVFYVDGVRAAITYKPDFEFNPDLRIGAVNIGVEASFLGLIDELAIYDRALAATEIPSIYNAQRRQVQAPDCSQQWPLSQTPTGYRQRRQCGVASPVGRCVRHECALQAQLVAANGTPTPR